MKFLKLSALSLIILFSVSSCSQRLIDFTVISSKNVSLGIDKSKGKQVKGKSMQVFAIGVNIKDAIDKALQSAGPGYDLLIDGVVRIKQYPFYGGYTVEGTAVNTAKMRASLGEEEFNKWCLNHSIEPEVIEEASN